MMPPGGRPPVGKGGGAIERILYCGSGVAAVCDSVTTVYIGEIGKLGMFPANKVSPLPAFFLFLFVCGG